MIHENLKIQYETSKSVTRNKSLKLPKRLQTVRSKKSYNKAIMKFNILPSKFKTIKSFHKEKSNLKMDSRKLKIKKKNQNLKQI